MASGSNGRARLPSHFNSTAPQSHPMRQQFRPHHPSLQNQTPSHAQQQPMYQYGGLSHHQTMPQSSNGQPQYQHNALQMARMPTTLQAMSGNIHHSPVQNQTLPPPSRLDARVPANRPTNSAANPQTHPPAGQQIGQEHTAALPNDRQQNLAQYSTGPDNQGITPPGQVQYLPASHHPSQGCVQPNVVYYRQPGMAQQPGVQALYREVQRARVQSQQASSGQGQNSQARYGRGNFQQAPYSQTNNLGASNGLAGQSQAPTGQNGSTGTVRPSQLQWQAAQTQRGPVNTSQAQNGTHNMTPYNVGIAGVTTRPTPAQLRYWQNQHHLPTGQQQPLQAAPPAYSTIHKEVIDLTSDDDEAIDTSSVPPSAVSAGPAVVSQEASHQTAPAIFPLSTPVAPFLPAKESAIFSNPVVVAKEATTQPFPALSPSASPVAPTLPAKEAPRPILARKKLSDYAWMAVGKEALEKEEASKREARRISLLSMKPPSPPAKGTKRGRSDVAPAADAPAAKKHRTKAQLSYDERRAQARKEREKKAALEKQEKAAEKAREKQEKADQQARDKADKAKAKAEAQGKGRKNLAKRQTEAVAGDDDSDSDFLRDAWDSDATDDEDDVQSQTQGKVEKSKDNDQASPKVRSSPAPFHSSPRWASNPQKSSVKDGKVDSDKENLPEDEEDAESDVSEEM